MKIKSLFLRFWKPAAWMLLGALLMWVAFSGGPARLAQLLAPQPVAAAAPASASLAPDAPANTYSCLPVSVAVYTNRFHVQCNAASPEGFSYFAMATNNSAQVARFLTIATMAEITSRHVTVGYDPADLSGQNAIGCLNADCRLIQSLSMDQP